MIQYCGKDNLRQQTAMWQAMLLAAGLIPSQKVIVDGFITGPGGVKMSKSLGNVVSPLELINDYGTDALRYYVTREAHPFEDTAFSRESFKEAYNANLANGLGNLTSRVMKMAETNLETPVTIDQVSLPLDFCQYLDSYEIQKAADLIWQEVALADKYIQETQPFKLIKTDQARGREIISDLVLRLAQIAKMLEIVMPTTSEKILNLIKQNKSPEVPLFVRKD
jgi:methionyl-tRNA synthetase